MISKTFKTIVIFVLIVSCFFETNNVFAEHSEVIGMKTAIKVKNGDIVECMISSKENVYSYKCQIVYSAELFEFVKAEPLYIRGYGDNLTYFRTENQSVYNAEDAKVYKENGIVTGYSGQENNPGMFRYVSTRFGYTDKADGDNIIKVTLRAKKDDSGFIYITDEESVILSEDNSLSSHNIASEFTAVCESKIASATKISDVSEIVYPYRKNPKKIEFSKDVQISGTKYEVSYNNPEVNINVKDGYITVCNLAYKSQNGYTPIVNRISPIGTIEQIRCINYDHEAGKLSFAFDDFGDYVVSDANITFADVDSERTDCLDIYYLATLDIVNKDVASFSPDKNITKAEYIKMLVSYLNTLNLTAVCWFDDVNLSDWYYSYVATALENKIISETNLFYPNAEITVKEAQTMLDKVLNITGDKDVKIEGINYVTRSAAAVAIATALRTTLH